MSRRVGVNTRCRRCGEWAWKNSQGWVHARDFTSLGCADHHPIPTRVFRLPPLPIRGVVPPWERQ